MLDVGPGYRFCLYHPPAPAAGLRGTILHVHPFAEEMNRSRRMAAWQARAFAAAGFGVLQIDLLGCGDSSGDFADARWDAWKNDLHVAQAWLRRRLDAPSLLWGVRAGALLALDFARDHAADCSGLVLWQPVPNGDAHLTQFLRLRLASDMLADDGTRPTGTGELRAALARGEPIEVAGYELSPALALALDGMRLADCNPAGMPVHWLEVVAAGASGAAPATARVLEHWRREGVQVDYRAVEGQAFWSLPEAAECPALIAATTAAVLGTAGDRGQA